MSGPGVIVRGPARPAAGAPLVLGNPAPPTNSFGAPLPIAERVRQALGTPAPQSPAPVQQQQPLPPMQQPGYPNPHGLVPPGRIPNARVGADPTVTGSIAKPESGKKSGQAKSLEASLLSPHSMAEEAPSSEAASVFNLLSENGKRP